MAFERELILLGARDVVFFRDKFRGRAHVVVFVGFPQPVGDHRVHHLPVAEPVTGAGLRQQVRTIRHTLHAAGHDHFTFTEQHGLRRQCDGLES